MEDLGTVIRKWYFKGFVHSSRKTISDIVAKMGGYLSDCKSEAYGNWYFKEKLLKQYSDYNTTIHLGMMTRKHINQQFYKLQQNLSKVAPLGDTYLNQAELKLALALDYVPTSLRFLLQHLFVGLLVLGKQLFNQYVQGL